MDTARAIYDDPRPFIGLQPVLGTWQLRHVAVALDAARRLGRQDAAEWHDEQVEIVMAAENVTQNPGIARLSLADIHERCAAEIRALP